MTEIVVARVQQEVGQDGLNPFDSGNRVLGAPAIVDAEIRIVVILMFTTNADDTAIRKLRTRRAVSNEAPDRVHRVCKIVIRVSEGLPSIPRRQSPWTSLEFPERIVHISWIGCPVRVGISICIVLFASDLEQVFRFFITVALKYVKDACLGGERRAMIFFDGTCAVLPIVF